MECLFHKALTLLLTTAVLTGSLVPPGIRHAHAAGDQPHSQGSHVEAHAGHNHGSRHHHHDSSHEFRDHDESAQARVDNGLGQSIAHMHFSFFGFDFSFPLPHRDGSDGPLTPDERQLEVVRLTDDVTPVSRVDVVNAVAVTTAPLDYFDRFDAEMSRSAKSGVRAVDRILLCDSARFERSGVLLI